MFALLSKYVSRLPVRRVIPDREVDDRPEERAVKLPIQSFSQTDWYSCGATAAWALLKYLKPDANFDHFYRRCSPSPLSGMETSEVAAALRAEGVKVRHSKTLNFPKIAAEIRQGHPILTNVGDSMPGGDHWVFIYGVGLQPSRVYVGNWGRKGHSTRRMTWAEFKTFWYPEGEGLIITGLA